MNSLKIIVISLILLTTLNAKDTFPTYTYEASGGVTQLLIKNNKLYASTSYSAIDIFDLNTNKKIKTIKFKKIKDFLGDEVHAKVYSIDILNDKILALSQGERGGRNLQIYQNEKFTSLIEDTKRMFIEKAAFLDKNRIIFSLLSNELVIFDINKKETIKKIDVSLSKFSDFVLSDDKKRVIIADESGNLKIHSTKNLAYVNSLDKHNLDNVYKVDMNNNIIVTAGQDRRSVIYNLNNNRTKHIESDFLIYSAGINKSGQFAAISINENNDVLVFETSTLNKIAYLKNNPALISDIVFKSKSEVYVSSDHSKINYYKIKPKD
ncbi:MAG: WD40 repeat domain-containing protein [Campylobacterota bacterium]